MFEGPTTQSIIKRAQEKGLVYISIHDLRRFTKNKHHTADDTPYGGGEGMVLKPEPIFEAVESLEKGLVILLTPQGKLFNQKSAKELIENEHLIFICGHYEGVDERVKTGLVDLELSIGDYVTTGGELPCMVIIDVIVRLIPGVLGNLSSIINESFYEDMLDYPHYTRPQNFRGMEVPEILLSGNHGAIAKWRRNESIKRTVERRPELLEQKLGAGAEITSWPF